MAFGKRSGIVIAGGGLAGSLAALAMARLRPEIPLMLVGEEEAFGGRQSWTFFEDELGPDELKLIEPLISHRWPGYYVAFPGGSRKLKAELARISPGLLDKAVRETLGPERYRLEAKIIAVRDDSLILQGGEKLAAEGALDARDAAHLAMLDLGWRNVAARTYRFTAPHRVDRPVLYDTTLSAEGGCRFASCLPFGEKELLIEDVRYARELEGDADAAGARIQAYVAKRGWKGRAFEAEPAESLPIALGGDFGAYWRAGGARVAKLGPRGGFFHPVNGSPLADAAATALMLAEQRDFGGEQLHDAFEDYATSLWNRREYHRAFNASLLIGGSGAPCEAMERLYALDPVLIARFHCERLGLLDRRRISAALGR